MIGSAVITVYLLVAWRVGVLGSARDESASVRDRLGIAAVSVSIVIYVAPLCLADLVGIEHRGEFSFGRLWAINYLVCFFWLLFDTFVIDILLVGVWHPDFLTLPDARTHGSASHHLATIPRGMVLGVVLSGTATVISWFVMPA